MSVAAAQAQKFYEQVAAEGRLFTFRDDGHLLVFPKDGYAVIPYWSSKARLTRVQEQHPKYRGWAMDEMDLSYFLSDLAPRFQADGMRVGVNWSGGGLTGYDIEVQDLLVNLKHYTER